MADGYVITTSVTVGSAAVGEFVPIGVIAHVAASFSDSTGTSANPAVVKFAYRADAIGSTTTLTYGTDVALVRASTGNYYVDLSTTESAGRWWWRFYATGTGQASAADKFYVRPTPAS